ncbi:hypothetical protein EDB92DRAFT_1365791 [Lactarius akahatsu]|uniref:Uncharacterized protein n=1 Tax=Lactarius akahatsu TaxID=416441 RepID=A0AAD4LBV1_9AGAM|nr:hypothetical protein EDB92DRAFT_1365791 [Lactarius akahatsu]
MPSSPRLSIFNTASNSWQGGSSMDFPEGQRRQRRLVASWLPSNMADETSLVVDDLSVRVKDFALDPSQDLIVFLEHRPAASANSSAPNSGAGVCIHLKKLSAGAVAPHPAAKVPVLCSCAPGPVHGCMIQVVEVVVGVYFWMPLHGVLIWNWMTGEELVFIQGDEVPECIWEFSLLSPRAYMITALKDGGEIRIYSFCVSLVIQAANPRRHAAPSQPQPNPCTVRAHDDNRALPRASAHRVAVFVRANGARSRLHVAP